jgi:hypothetical protein
VNNGTPGGSDQWYLLPIGNDIPATLSASSSPEMIAAATNTSLKNITSYKIVNRNSGNVLQFFGGSWALAAPSFGSSAQAAVITNANAAQPFLVEVPTTTATVQSGLTATFSLEVVAGSETNETVALAMSGLPSGATYTFNPASVVGQGSSTLTISTTTTLAAGTYPLTISGTAGGFTYTASATLTVYPANWNFTLTATPPAVVTAASDDLLNFNVTLASALGYGGTPALTVAGFPTGSTGDFSPGTISMNSPNSTLLVETPTTVAPGVYPVTVTASDGTLTHTANSLLVVNPLSNSCITQQGNNQSTGPLYARQTSTFTAEWDVSPSANPSNSNVGFSQGAQTIYTSDSVMARFNPTGQIDARNGSVFAAASTINYRAGKWYHFRAVVSPATQTYSLYVTPQGGSEILVGSNYAFRTGNGTITAIDHWVAVSFSGYGTLDVCNLKVDGTIQGTVQLTTTASLYLNSDGSYEDAITVTNTGTGTAPNAQLNSAMLGAATGSTLPVTLGDMQPGVSVIVPLNFPASTGTPGAAVVERYSGTYTGGTFSAGLRGSLPTQ